MSQHAYGMAGLMRHVLGTMGNWSSSSVSGRAYSLVRDVVVNYLPGRLLHAASPLFNRRYPSGKPPTSRYRLVYTCCCNGLLS
ncbi:hypothetical protein XPA_004139 [Xanthoria parietina]